ncbi:CBS domain protein [Nocardia pseudobrasiliensis]|uniref:CBS domain protein n=2 Tax=Nocardia pseudobrasiliensis TaxID=45979 RepID=A0A370HR70_9NOCA|nr:CBS domain protein [Nocardia pseudobrasiliensis]
MTRDVVVQADTPFRDIVGIVAEHRISGVPVLDPQRHVVGMVTEADLMGRQALTGGIVGATMWDLLWRRAFARRGVTRTATEVMNAPVVSVAPDAGLTAAAATVASAV